VGGRKRNDFTTENTEGHREEEEVDYGLGDAGRYFMGSSDSTKRRRFSMT
jgi:hypothetical protein